MKRDFNLIICVFACDKIEKYRQEIRNINATWGKMCVDNVKLLFFIGEDKTDEFSGENYINLPNVKDDYESASYKQFLGLKYIYENYEPEFVHCCGTDTFINIPKLVCYIHQYKKEECLYIGGHGCHRQIGDKLYYYHSGGPGFVITHSCLGKLYPFLDTIMNEWITICKENNVEYLITACDVAISYFLQKPEINAMIIKTDDLSFISCNCYGYPCHQGQIEMKNIICCHLMNIENFVNFNEILLKKNHFL